MKHRTGLARLLAFVTLLGLLSSAQAMRKDPPKVYEKLEVDKIPEKELGPLKHAMAYLWWGTFDGVSKGIGVMRGVDEVEAYTDAIGWVPLQALVAEEDALRKGVTRVEKLAGAKAPCYGLERGGGFVAAAINSLNMELKCVSVPKPGGQLDVKPLEPFYKKGKPLPKKLNDQTALMNLIQKNKAAPSVVIVDTMVSGNSIGYTLKTVEALLTIMPKTRFTILAIRDGSRKGFQGKPAFVERSQFEYTAESGDKGQPFVHQGDKDWEGWFKHPEEFGESAHEIAERLLKQHKGQVEVVISEAWYLVAEDVAAQLDEKVPKPLSAQTVLHLYAFLNPKGQLTAPSIGPNDDEGKKLMPYYEESKASELYIWRYRLERNETLRGKLIELIANPKQLVEHLPGFPGK